MEEKKPRNTEALQGEVRRLVRNGGDENSCGLLSRVANYRPLNVASEVFAANFTLGKSFDCWANVSGDFTLAIAPEAHGLSRYAKLFCKSRRASNDRNCSANRFHAENSTLVERLFQQVSLCIC